jgi:glycosyltransferase involved in cell wall biosynthesis
MNLGTPVVLSNDSALTEVAGGAGIVAPILGAEAALDDVTRILNRALDESFDRRDELVAAGHVRSAEFSWAKTATRVTEIHRQLTTRSSD